MLFECQKSQTAVLVVTSVSLRPAFDGFLWNFNASYKFNCFSDKDITSVSSDWFNAISFMYDVNSLDSRLFFFLVVGVILTGFDSTVLLFIDVAKGSFWDENDV